MTEQPQKPAPLRRRHSTFDWSAAVIVAIAIAAASYVYLRDGSERFIAVMWGDLDLFVDILPKVLAGCLIAAFITILLPREMIERWVGAESGLKGIVIATFAGVILPGGPFAIFPIAGAFLAVGADISAAITLITSWSLMGINRAIVWEMPFFGFDFVAWRSLAALPLPIIAGLTVRGILRLLAQRDPRMINIVVTGALWMIVLAMALAVAMRSRPVLRESAKNAAGDFLRLLPRIMIGVMGSGYIAAALPQETVGHWLGSSSGLVGIALATIAGALTPGGPVIGFSLGAAALKGGAGAPQVIAYSTAWALFAFPRLITFELPIMPARVVWLRVLASLSLPFLAAAGAMLLGKP